MLTIPTTAHAASIACGGGTSTGRIAVNGCISAQKEWVERVPFREVTSYVKLRNTGTRALNVSYEAYARFAGGDWKKMGNSRTTVGAGQTVGPVEVGAITYYCDSSKVEIRVRAQANGSAWSSWSPASTKQCQT
ncbi:hypothetical protein ACFYQA_27650 [Streptomyces sp. NPDC005774]|uniref:hypothetical protein n=1 Tax=Streptomyces sp. NPDC005774 TaxID=3364728 RepID=UPI003684E13E